MENGDTHFQDKTEAMPLASFKRSCIIKYGKIKRVVHVNN